MVMEEKMITPEQDARLDLLLSKWRQQHQLASPLAEQVRQNALLETETLPIDWWENFSKAMNRVLFSTNQIQQQMMTTYVISKQTLRPGGELPSYQQVYLRPITRS